MDRPTYKELNNKIILARKIAEQGLVNLLNPEAVAADAMELGYRIDNELTNSLLSVLDDTTPDNYAGRRPPEKSYENIIIENSLYAFRTRAKKFNCKVYLKFTLFDEQMWVVSFHRNRNKRGPKR